MRVTKQAPSLAIFSAILLFEIILVSRAAGQKPGRSDAKTITLGIVAETDQKEIEAHFQDFVGYLARKLSSVSKLEGRIVLVSTQSRLASLLSARRADF